MKFSLLMVIKTVLFVIAGAALLLLPTTVLPWYGITAEPGAVYMTQILGAAFLLVAVLAWAVGNVPQVTIQRNIAIAAFIGDAIGFSITLINQLSTAPVGNTLGWINVAVFLVMALGFGYFVLFESNLFGAQAQRQVAGF